MGSGRCSGSESCFTCFKCKYAGSLAMMFKRMRFEVRYDVTALKDCGLLASFLLSSRGFFLADLVQLCDVLDLDRCDPRQDDRGDGTRAIAFYPRK
jgi:hypothetical protein